MSDWNDDDVDDRRDRLAAAAAALIPGVDYEPAVCDNCGKDEHSPGELAACIASMMPPERCSNCMDAAPLDVFIVRQETGQRVATGTWCPACGIFEDES